MAFETLDYDPLTGVRTLFDFDEASEQAIIRRELDVSALLKVCAEIRNTGAADTKQAKKESWRLYALIPPLIEYQIMKDTGINPWTADESGLRKIRGHIDRNYPNLKTTDMKDG